ncbi:uncharacterized protein LOC126410334 [Nymphaea colorata]|uniref:uncharacterized protein LOC126410334 n=1 Tax=Nymphaea colorata TaxID=210225 RepID=UPI00214E086A|nr:uncharacterized protein LOC126410334 [Nymphaea colorata]
MAKVINALAETATSHLLGAVTILLEEKVKVILNAKDDLRKLERFQKATKIESELKDAFYDAQDIGLSKREKDSALNRKVRKPWNTLYSCFKEHVSFPYHLGNEIKKINQRLDEINNDREMVDLGTIKTTPKVSGEGPVSGVQPPIGREGDKNAIIEKLLFDGATLSSALDRHVGISIISMTGQGGIGKTTPEKSY